MPAYLSKACTGTASCAATTGPGLMPFEHCPECGAQASVWKINEGQFEIAPPLDERSSATASFVGYAVLGVLAVFMAIGTANLLGFI